MMLSTLFCLAGDVWPVLIALARQVEIHATVMSLCVFVFIALRVWRRRSWEDSCRAGRRQL